MSNSRILFVDDDEKILKGIVRQQGDDFDITTAIGPMEALQILEEEEPFAVVVSDMRMPEMNGVQLLKRIREMNPDTVRIILTGFAELTTTIEAINEGNIFRFLAKPCDADAMAGALQSALRQYALVQAERELVEETLHGSVKVLADVLSLVSPLAFGQSTRVRATVDGILKRMTIEDKWQVEIAAMLSSLGCVTLPESLLQKKLAGEPLDASERSLFRQHPQLASELIRNIPRLEEVSEIIADQLADDGPKAKPCENLKTQVLRLALEFDLYESVNTSPLHALNELKKANVAYDTELFDAFEEYVKQEKNVEVLEIPVSQVREGMVIASELRNKDGNLLMSKGQRITSSAMRLLESLRDNKAVTGNVMVVQSDATVAV